jgi:hypothetical protein
MTTPEFITVLFYHVDEQLRTVPKHPEARLWPSEVVTLGLLHALKGGGNRGSPSARGSFASSRPITPGPRLSWPPPRSSASSTPMGAS